MDQQSAGTAGGTAPGGAARKIRGRARLLAGLLVIWLLVFLLTYLPAGGNGSDFQVYYAAAVVARHGGDPFNWPVLWRAEQVLYNGGIGHTRPFNFAPFGNPPPFAQLMRPFTVLTEPQAYTLWFFGLLAAMAGGVYLGLAQWPRGKRTAAAAFAALSPAGLLNLRLGQTSALLLLTLGLSVWLSQRRHPMLAGAALALGMLKPHLMVPVALIVMLSAEHGRRMRTAIGFALGVLAWACATALIGGGTEAFAHWWSSVNHFAGSIRLQPDVSSVPGMYYSSVSQHAAGILNALCLVAAAAIIAMLAWRTTSNTTRDRCMLFGAGIAAYFALTPYVHTEDQVVLIIPLLLLIGADGHGLRGAAVLLASVAVLVCPMVVFRDYHTEVINALPPICLFIAYLLEPQASTQQETPARTAAPSTSGLRAADG